MNASTGAASNRATLIFDEDLATFATRSGSSIRNLHPEMNRTPSPSDDLWESDAVWKLLDQAPARSAGPAFASDVVRAAKLMEMPTPWWSKIFSPFGIAGLATASVAAAVAIMSFASMVPATDSRVASLDSPEAAAIQEIAETEALLAAADQLDELSDTELVSLIGF